MDYHPFQGAVEILLVASCYRNQDKLRPDGPLGSYADLRYLTPGDLTIILMISYHSVPWKFNGQNCQIHPKNCQQSGLFPY